MPKKADEFTSVLTPHSLKVQFSDAVYAKLTAIARERGLMPAIFVRGIVSEYVLSQTKKED